MKKILISCDLNIDLLSKFFNLTKNFESDIDLAIQIDYEFRNSILSKIKSNGTRVLGIPRLNKIEQTKVLENYEINHPKTFYNEKTLEPISSLGVFNSYVDLEEFVIKPILGARGVGVKKVTREEYKDCINNSESIDKLFKVENEYVEKNCPDVSGDYIKSNFKSLLIQEPIEVYREFRLVVFKSSESIAYERVKSDGQFCGNLSHGSKAQEIDNETFYKYLKPVEDSFGKIMDDFSYPWLSIDVYVDKQGNVGVFEFQMEFAYDGFNHIVVRDAMKKSIESYF